MIVVAVFLVRSSDVELVIAEVVMVVVAAALVDAVLAVVVAVVAVAVVVYYYTHPLPCPFYGLLEFVVQVQVEPSFPFVANRLPGFHVSLGLLDNAECSTSL